MEQFLINITSFPTAIYSVLIVICLFFWLATVLGMSEFESFDGDVDFVDGLDIEGMESGDNSFMATLSGILVKFGLVGVPLTISITILSIVGWLISYYTVHFVMPFESGSIMRYVVGLPVFLITLYVSAKLTALFIRPLRPFFDNSQQDTEKYILGQTALVRTSRVDDGFGEAVLEDGGAGLILKVRATGSEKFKAGDRVVLFEKIDIENNVYRVISEDDFETRKLKTSN